MNTTKFLITSATAIATAGALGLAIAQTGIGGSTAGGAANQDSTTKAPAASTSSGTTSSGTMSTDSSTTAAGTTATREPMARSDRG